MRNSRAPGPTVVRARDIGRSRLVVGWFLDYMAPSGLEKVHFTCTWRYHLREATSVIRLRWSRKPAEFISISVRGAFAGSAAGTAKTGRPGLMLGYSQMHPAEFAKPCACWRRSSDNLTLTPRDGSARSENGELVASREGIMPGQSRRIEALARRCRGRSTPGFRDECAATRLQD